MLIGALNWSRFWFASPGRDTPRSLARKFVGFLRRRKVADVPRLLRLILRKSSLPRSDSTATIAAAGWSQLFCATPEWK